MTFSTTQSKFKKVLFKTLKILVVTAFWILVWEAVARFVARDNESMYLLLPRPVTVFRKWLEIGFTAEYLGAVGRTLLRVFWGFMLGVVSGFVFGVATNTFKVVDMFLSPLLKMIRAIPVVAITILFFALFKSDALPTSVVVLMVAPIIWQTVHDGLSAPNQELMEMAKIYRLSAFKVFLYIKLPSMLPSLLTATVNALGLAWKSGIAAEVICEPNVGLGTILIEGKGMIDFSSVYAVTLTVVILSLIIEVALKSAAGKFVASGRNDV